MSTDHPIHRKVEKLAKIISLIASPFLTIPLFGLLVIHAYAQSSTIFWVDSALFLGLTILVPFLWILYGVKTGKYTDIHVMVQEQRTEPFMIATIGALVLALAYHFLGAPQPLIVLAVIMILNGIIFLLLTLLWKLSMHAAALSASILIAAILISPFYFYLFLAVPVVIWARIQRKRHSLGQSVLAVAIVWVVTFLTIELFGL